MVVCRDNCISWRDRPLMLHYYGYYKTNSHTSIEYPQRITVSSFDVVTRKTLILRSLSMISLSLFYSSLTKLFLLLLLTIWLPASSLPSPRIENALPSWLNHLRTCNSNFVADILELLDDDNLDREWIVRNVLGGMSAGFGLRGMQKIAPHHSFDRPF